MPTSAEQAEVVIEQLLSMVVKVIQRSNMHQKIAILDNEIAWEGSLNILSHRDTEEHMRRFEGQSAIEIVFFTTANASFLPSPYILLHIYSLLFD